jgi:putative addiction module component (TIGR02574 family)
LEHLRVLIQPAYDEAVTTNAQKLFQQALTLVANDRAELAAQLLASLDGDAEANVESAWAAEIERRAAEARQNPDDDEDWRTVLDEIQREVLAR